MTIDSGRVTGSRPSDQAPSGLGGSRFDPARIAERLTEAQRRCVRVLSAEFKTPPRGHAYWAGSMLYGDKLTQFRYAGAFLNRREYRLTPIGLAVKDAIAMEARQGGDARLHPKDDSAGRQASPGTGEGTDHG